MPVTVYLLIFAAILVPGYQWLKAIGEQPGSSFRDITRLFLSIALAFCAALLIFGFITVAVSFVYLYYSKAKGLLQVHVHTPPMQHSEPGAQFIRISIHPLLRPLAGFIRIRLRYDEQHYTGKITLIGGNNSLFSLAYEGGFIWRLPAVREYQIQEIILYFEDFFQFFSLALSLGASCRFHIRPGAFKRNTVNANPRKTEENNTRIEELKKVEGELINYKHFETNDDVRRIVWKIYAKNKELVVRIPEILDPYASHIYFYPSFHTAFSLGNNSVTEEIFSTYYKNLCWTVYKQLAQKGLEVRYVTDQEVAPLNFNEAEERIKYSIAASRWQKNNSLREFVKTGSASVVMISSLNDVADLNQLVSALGTDVTMVYVPLSESLRRKEVWHWLKWIFIESADKKTSRQITAWKLMPLSRQINENEKKIESILKQVSKAAII